MKTNLFYIKTITRSALFLLTLLFLFFLTYNLYESIFVSITYFTANYIYSIICFNLFLVTASTYTMLNRSNVLIFLERDSLKKQYSLILSCGIISSIIALLPVSLMFLFANDLTQPTFLLKGITHFLIIWLISNTLAAVIGSSMGLLIKNKFSYLSSLIVYGFFVWVSSNIPIKPINKYLNIFDDNTYIVSNNLSGIIFNTDYFLDKLFIILIIFSFIFIVRIFLVPKKKIINSLILSILVVSIFSLPIWSNSNYQTVTFPTNQSMKNISYEIQEYNMNLELNNKLKNKATLKIGFLENSKDIVLALDNIFSVKNLKISNSPTSFTHNNNLINIPSTHKKGDVITLTIDYEGTVNMNNNIGFNTYYVAESAINLPGSVFDWYPNLRNQSSIDFEVTVNSSAKIYSNISSLSSEEEHLVGTANSLNIFAGQYQQAEVDGIQYIIPNSFTVNGFKSDLESIIKSMLGNKNFPEDDLLVLKDKKYKRVIVGIWPFGVSSSPVQIIGDTILVYYNQ